MKAVAVLPGMHAMHCVVCIPVTFISGILNKDQLQ